MYTIISQYLLLLAVSKKAGYDYEKLSEKINLMICCQERRALGGIAAVLVADKIRNWQSSQVIEIDTVTMRLLFQIVNNINFFPFSDWNISWRPGQYDF